MITKTKSKRHKKVSHQEKLKFEDCKHCLIATHLKNKKHLEINKTNQKINLMLIVLEKIRKNL